MKSFKSIMLLIILAVIAAPDVSAQDDEWDEDFQIDVLKFWDRPTISLYYGFTNSFRKDLDFDIAGTGLSEIRIGFSSEKIVKEGIVNYDFSNISVTNLTKDLYKSGDSEPITLEAWKFGVNWEDGYGYNMGDGSFVLYNSNGVTWTNSEFTAPADQNTRRIVDLYDGSIRFGNQTNMGLRARILSNLAFDVNFERHVIYERHLFWMWAGSAMLEQAGANLIEEFTKRVLKTTPYAVPIVSFFLKSMYYYGVYELRKEKMNWPFDTSPGLINDSFKAGVVFYF